MTTTPDWAGGYVVDVPYVRNYLAGLMPLNLAMAAVLAGVEPPDADRPFTYLDLGCGNGFTPALVAAAYPHADVWGNDFNPAHVRNAQATAQAAGLGNAHFVEASFADLPERDPPPFDFIVAHGIWSWVGEAQRGEVVALLDRLLKPGGLAVVSYNCHPGWDALLPLRRLLTEAGGDGSAVERVGRALAAARGLRDVGADYFRNVPAASALVDHLSGADPHYVAHEYLNANWALFRPGNVAAALAPAGLRRIGQARIFDNRDDLWLTAEQRALLGAPVDEDLRDLMLDRRFRRDLFVRDGAGVDVDGWFADRRFALAKPRAACADRVDLRAGEIVVPPLATRLLDALATAPATTGALAGRLGVAADAVRDTLSLLAALGHVQPALPREREAARRAATDRFNAAALAAARMGEPAPALASPVTGAGVAVSAGDQLLLDARAMGVPLEAIGDGDVAEFLPFWEMLGIA